MAITYVNGNGKPIIKVYNSSDVLVDTITLPQTDERGLIESWQDIYIEHELVDRSILKKILGYRGYFDLSYEVFITGTDSLLINKLKDYEKQGNKLILTPRSNLGRRYFEVMFQSDKELSIGQNLSGNSVVGNRLVHIYFKTTKMESGINWIDPELIQYTMFIGEPIFFIPITT